MKTTSFLKYLQMSILAFILAFTISSCSDDPIDGCTNPNSDNYNAEADIDDGSCILSRDKFLGTYNAVQDCEAAGSAEAMLTVNAASSGENAIDIVGLLDEDLPVKATVDQSNITVPMQFIFSDGEDFFMEGEGSISGDIITINVTLSTDVQGDIDTCVLTLTRI